MSADDRVAELVEEAMIRRHWAIYQLGSPLTHAPSVFMCGLVPLAGEHWTAHLAMVTCTACIEAARLATRPPGTVVPSGT